MSATAAMSATPSITSPTATGKSQMQIKKLSYGRKKKLLPPWKAYAEMWATLAAPDAASSISAKAYVYDKGFWDFGVKGNVDIASSLTVRKWVWCRCAIVEISATIEGSGKLNLSKPGAAIGGAAVVATGVYYAAPALVHVAEEIPQILISALPAIPELTN